MGCLSVTFCDIYEFLSFLLRFFFSYQYKMNLRPRLALSSSDDLVNDDQYTQFSRPIMTNI